MNDFGRRIYVFALICLMYLPNVVVPYYQYPSVYWAPKNCRFNLNKPPNSAYEFSVKPFGKLYFVCPNIALWNDISSTGPQVSMMYENLMLVDKKGYETCTVNKARNSHLNRLILKCDGDVSHLKYTLETFARQRTDLLKMRYNDSQTYYFISTSNGSKESLDNLSGGHCKTHNMKLKITVCGSKDPCVFKMPKCPFTNVFYKPTTTTSTHAPTSKTTLSQNTTTRVAAGRNARPTSQKKTEVKETEANKIKKQIIPTEPPTHPKGAKLSSDETMWGSQRKHIIIHITMALLILVLTLSLIYVLVTRRNPKSKPVSFNSKLYGERPTSAMPLNDDLNGDARAV